MLESIMVLGGGSSGKSVFAEDLAREMESFYNCDVFYLATGIGCDQEFAARIKKHQQRRPGHWHTVEEPRRLARALRNWKHQPSVVLVDCIGTWTANLIYGEDWQESRPWSAEREEACLQEARDFIAAWSGLSGALILVADEVGMGIVPEYPDARIFRDLNGRINQMLAAAAEQVYFVTAGIANRIKGGGAR
jgi:adenosylcobinamide kinase/adenosylcobinamide-phosphate guanylyltransferase